MKLQELKDALAQVEQALQDVTKSMEAIDRGEQEAGDIPLIAWLARDRMTDRAARLEDRRQNLQTAIEAEEKKQE